MKNRLKLFITLMLVPALCLSLTGCPRVWGHSSSGGSTSGGVVVDVPF